jgi:spore coat polysaccharide biosynthesis protein SpsF
MFPNADKKLIAIIQARLSSTRLPGKVLLPFGQGTILECLVSRLRKATSISRIVIATSNESSDDNLADFILTNNIAELYRGSLLNVFSRYQEIAFLLESDYYLRITADCPLVCPDLVDSMFLTTKEMNLDFCSNSHEKGITKGFDLELYSRALMLSIKQEQLSRYDLEHVTPVMYEIEKNAVLLLKYDQDPRLKGLNLSIDTLRDYVFLKKLEGDHHISRMSYKEIKNILLTQVSG